MKVNNNQDFAKRLIQLAEDFDTYDFMDNNDGIEKNFKNIESDLIKGNIDWMQDWLTNVKAEILSKNDDPDYIGYFIVECNALLQYLEEGVT